MSHSGSLSGRHSFSRSYRSRRSRMDPTTKRLTIAAGSLGLLLVAGMAAWSLTGHRAAGIPVIEADSRPLRVKPDNPGGMTVVGANEQIMSGSADGASDMAPLPEKPDPQALRAQMQVSAASGAAPMAATPIAAPSSNMSPPLADAPAPRVAAAPPARAATGGAMVQLAAVDSEAAAAAEWQRLQKKAPDLLADRRPVVQRAEHDGKPVWRIRTGGFADIAEATAFCARVRAKGAGCSLASF